MTGNRERALAIVRQRAHQPVTLAGCNIEELAILPVARAVAELCQVMRKMALEHGIVAFDEWHHAPLCPANNWSRMALPQGPCTCGAAARRIR
jgi:hypothetical protein